MNEHKSISIADQIFELLERDILAGKYPRGETLAEVRLSAELGVSRTPIREAIQRLEQEKLLEETNRGAVVVGISEEDMLDMYEIRLKLEGIAAQRAAKNITDEQLAQMREAIDLQRFYIDMSATDGTDNSDRIKNLDSRFHELLYAGSGSNVYINTLGPMHKKMTKYRKASIKKSGRAKQSVNEHNAIYEALAAHDSELAFSLTVEHVKNARDSIMKVER